MQQRPPEPSSPKLDSLVRPYRRRHQKTDRADAKALLEAFRNEHIHPVPVKTVERQNEGRGFL